MALLLRLDSRELLLQSLINSSFVAVGVQIRRVVFALTQFGVINNNKNTLPAQQDIILFLLKKAFQEHEGTEFGD